jgi:Zn-dependent protease with chaperone function
VLYSDVVDALEERPDAINFYIGHEIGHIKRNHLRWSALLAPAAFLPLLGAAYARARVHLRPPRLPCLRRSEKRAGRSGRAGGRRQALAPDERSRYTAQAQQSGGFWMSFHELVGDYPWLVKRMAVVRGLAHGNEVPPAGPSRPGLSAGLVRAAPGVGGAGSCWR